MRLPIALVLLAACTVQQPASPPLIEAVRNGDARTVRLLCARGADPDAPHGRNGWTPLLHAVHKNQIAAASALLAVGASPDRAAPNGTTPLMMAAGHGNRELVALLLGHGARVEARDDGGALALDYALSGVADLDAFTLFRCQNDVTAMLARNSPAPQLSSAGWARMKGCAKPSSPYSRS